MRSAHFFGLMLLGDSEDVERAVARAIQELSGAAFEEPTSREVLRALASHVYRDTQDPRTAAPRDSQQLPPSMIWLGQMACLQRTSLALCLYGAHSHEQAASLLGVQVATVTEAVATGLAELADAMTGDGALHE